VTPRTASLQVAHSTGCPNAGRSSIESVDKACRAAKCQPRYYTLHREEGPDGRPVRVKGTRFTDRAVAEKALRRLQVALDEQRAGTVREQNVTFQTWAREYKRHVADLVNMGDLTRNTQRGYSDTLDLYAIPAFGNVIVRRVGERELAGFYRSLGKLSAAGRDRHLRQLSLCMAKAVDYGYATANPVPRFRKQCRLDIPKRGKAGFEDGEVERLYAAYNELERERGRQAVAPVYGHAVRFGVETGVRIGELIALDIDHLDLARNELLVEHTYNAVYGMGKPKGHKARTIPLTPQALAALGAWLQLRGTADGPLFPAPGGGRLASRQCQRNLERAMEVAGIPKVHPRLKLPRTYHSLRYTTSVLLQRRNAHPGLIEHMLGHSSLEFTYGVYGGWTPDQLREEAAKLAVTG
jgi:integrase/recombinase XerC